MDEDYRRMKLQQERREKKHRIEHYKRTGILLKKPGQEEDINDLFRGLKERAMKHSAPAPKAKIEISHLSR